MRAVGIIEVSVVLYSSTVAIAGVTLLLAAIASYIFFRRRGKLKRYDRFYFFVSVLAYIILFVVLYNANAAYRYGNQANNQSGTVWESESGNITISVSDEGATSGRLTYKGEEYSIYLATDHYSDSPQYVGLIDDNGVIREMAGFHFRMPNDCTEILKPMDVNDEFTKFLLDGEKRLVLNRVDS